MVFVDVEGRPIGRGAHMRLSHNGVEWTSRREIRDRPAGFLVVRCCEAGSRPEPVAVLVPGGRDVDKEAVGAVLVGVVTFPRPGGTTDAPLTCRRLILDSALADRDTVLVPDSSRAVIAIPTAELTCSRQPSRTSRSGSRVSSPT